MTKIAWVTDTAAFLSRDFIEENNIHVLALNVVFEEAALRETVDMTREEFYDRLRKAKVHPKTSQPNFGEQVALYERLKSEGYDCAIAVHTSSKQSGTVTSAPVAAEQAGFKTYAIDAKIGSFPMQKMLEKGMQLEKQRATPEQIVEEIIEMRQRSELSFIPASLDNLHKSGRVSGTAMLLSNLLNIKLVISYIDDGTCVVTKKVRADKRARKEIESLLEDAVAAAGVEQVAVIHCNNETGAKEWKAELQQVHPEIEFIETHLSAAVGVHAGEGTLGLSWVRSK
ncbi:MAG: DegV family protein [Lysinibacillus sp.]